jgi:hypothetical protein
VGVQDGGDDVSVVSGVEESGAEAGNKHMEIESNTSAVTRWEDSDFSLRTTVSLAIRGMVILTDETFTRFFYVPRFSDHHVLKPYY